MAPKRDAAPPQQADSRPGPRCSEVSNASPVSAVPGVVNVAPGTVAAE